MPALAVQGAICGLAVGAAQAVVLARRLGRLALVVARRPRRALGARLDDHHRRRRRGRRPLHRVRVERRRHGHRAHRRPARPARPAGWAMSRHVVFGTGQVGRHLVAQLVASGVDTVAVSRSGRPIAGATVVAGDARDATFTSARLPRRRRRVLLPQRRRLPPLAAGVPAAAGRRRWPARPPPGPASSCSRTCTPTDHPAGATSSRPCPSTRARQGGHQGRDDRRACSPPIGPATSRSPSAGHPTTSVPARRSRPSGRRCSTPSAAAAGRRSWAIRICRTATRTRRTSPPP